MPTEHCDQPSMLVHQRGMPSTLRFESKAPELLREPRPLRFPLHDEGTVPRPPAVVGKAQERERSGPTLIGPRSLPGGKPPELEQACLLRVERQLELREALVQIGTHPPRIAFTLEAHNEVIGVAHDNHAAARMPLPPLLNPQVEDVMKEDIREQGGVGDVVAYCLFWIPAQSPALGGTTRQPGGAAGSARPSSRAMASPRRSERDIVPGLMPVARATSSTL